MKTNKRWAVGVLLGGLLVVGGCDLGDGKGKAPAADATAPAGGPAHGQSASKPNAPFARGPAAPGLKTPGRPQTPQSPSAFATDPRLMAAKARYEQLSRRAEGVSSALMTLTSNQSYVAQAGVNPIYTTQKEIRYAFKRCEGLTGQSLNGPLGDLEGLFARLEADIQAGFRAVSEARSLR